MRLFLSLLAVTIFCSVASNSFAQTESLPVPIDVGDLTSDGAGGWNYLVRPLAPGETVPAKMFLPSDPFEIMLPPATPAQSDIALHAGEALVLVVPTFGNSSEIDVDVTHELVGDQLNAQIQRTFGPETGALWAPSAFEYLHPLGPLEAGGYTLHMTFISSDSDSTSPPTVITGFLTFTVTAIPNPATLGMLLPAVVIGMAARRFRVKEVSREPLRLTLK